MVEHLFNDIFVVNKIDPDGKKFDKITRIDARSENGVNMTLDIANEVYSLCAGDKFNMVLTTTLNLDGSANTGYFKQVGRKTLANDYQYVMHGKLYRISEDDDSNDNSSAKVDIYASFGGLLMMLNGDPSIAASFQQDMRLFLLIKKV